MFSPFWNYFFNAHRALGLRRLSHEVLTSQARQFTSGFVCVKAREKGSHTHKFHTPHVKARCCSILPSIWNLLWGIWTRLTDTEHTDRHGSHGPPTNHTSKNAGMIETKGTWYEGLWKGRSCASNIMAPLVQVADWWSLEWHTENRPSAQKGAHARAICQYLLHQSLHLGLAKSSGVTSGVN